MMTSRLRWVVMCGALALNMAVVGCGAASEEPDTAESVATKAPLATPIHGPARLLADALAKVGLRPEQRGEIETLAARAEERHEPMRAARKDFAEALATAIERGSIDRAALAPKIQAMGDAAVKAQPADRAALERLHTILSHDQRSELVDAIEQGFRDRMREHVGKARMAELAKEIHLTADQEDRIGDALKAKFAGEGRAAWREHGGHAKAVLEAFTNDRFSLDAVAPAVDAREKTAKRVEKLLDAAETVVPLLTSEQRTLAAGAIRRRAGDLDESAP